MKRLIAVLLASFILAGCAERSPYGPKTIGRLRYKADSELSREIEKPLKNPTHWEMGEWHKDDPMDNRPDRFFVDEYSDLGEGQ